MGWKAFQDLCSQVCEVALGRPVEIYSEAQDGSAQVVGADAESGGVVDLYESIVGRTIRAQQQIDTGRSVTAENAHLGGSGLGYRRYDRADSSGEKVSMLNRLIVGNQHLLCPVRDCRCSCAACCEVFPERLTPRERPHFSGI